MIPITSFAEKSDQASRFFRTKQKLTPLHPGPPGPGSHFIFLHTGAEAAGLLSERLSEAPSVRLTPYLPRVPCTVVAVLKTLYTYGVTPRGEQVPMSEPP